MDLITSRQQSASAQYTPYSKLNSTQYLAKTNKKTTLGVENSSVVLIYG